MAPGICCNITHVAQQAYTDTGAITAGFAASLGGNDRSAASSGTALLDLNAKPSYLG